jgi:CMP-N-acetylneuraminic acid synthetase
MKVFFIIKEKSQRIKNKNFKKIDNIELYKKTLYKFNKFQVFVDTDSDKILKECSTDINLRHVHAYKRDQKFIELEKSKFTSPTPLMIRNFLDNFATRNEIIVTSHVTSPFVKISTIKKAIKKMKYFDSVCSVQSIQNFSYLEKNNKYSPINFNHKIIQKTQSLNKIIHLNGAFFIIRKNIFLKNGLKRISNKNFFYELQFPEYIDIDNSEDLKIARKIATLYND